MEKDVLNTIIQSEEGDNTITPDKDKFIFWGHLNKTTGITGSEVISLGNKEERADRLKTFIDFDSGGEHMIVCQPVSYGGQGKFLDKGTGFSYPFVLSGVVSITDDYNNTYNMNVWVWENKSYGTIGELESL